MNILKMAAFGAVVCFVFCFFAGCHRSTETNTDRPRLTPQVTLRDVTFHSASLHRDMTYRAILPATVAANRKLPVVYLLHGGGGNFRDWSNYSDVGRYAEHGLILVMPEGDDSYYTNSAARPEDRYEDYIVHDLIADVGARFPAALGRQNRAIIGVSMGGFGAIKLALKYPSLFVFAGALSPAIDVPSRPFSIKRIGQWRRHRSIFGPWKGQQQHDNDPFVLVQGADPAKIPYLFLTCGDREGLLPANRSFASVLAQRPFPYEFHTVPGGHNWNQWNEQVPGLLRSLMGHVHVQ